MIFCERCKTYHEPGGPELCAPPYPSGNEKMIRECTLAIIGAIELHAHYFAIQKDVVDSTLHEDIHKDFDEIKKRLTDTGTG
jgi:hypothetical protein